MMGREHVQQVKWDKIPLYCRECHHVGHSGSTCYANGQRARPVKRNYHPMRNANPAEKEQQSHQFTAAGERGLEKIAPLQKEQHESHDQSFHSASTSNGKKEWNAEPRQNYNRTNQGTDEHRGTDGDGFQKQGRRRGPKHKLNNYGMPRTSSSGDGRQQKYVEKPNESAAGILQPNIPQQYKHEQGARTMEGQLDEAMKTFVKPSCYKPLEDGAFDIDDIGEGFVREEDDEIQTLEHGADTRPLECASSMYDMQELNMIGQREEGGQPPHAF